MPFVDNIWGPDLADVPLMSKFNKGIRFLLYVIDIFSKYAWVISLKDKKGITFADGFKKILDESNHKPNKIGVGKGRKFSNRPMKSWLKKKLLWKYIQHITMENLLLLKDLLELSRSKFISI